MKKASVYFSGATVALCQHDLWSPEDEEMAVPVQKKVEPTAIHSGGSRMNVDTLFFPGAVPVELTLSELNDLEEFDATPLPEGFGSHKVWPRGGIPRATNKNGAENLQNQIDEKIADAAAQAYFEKMQHRPKKGPFEYGAITLVGIYLALYIFGRKTNQDIVQKWLFAVSETLDKNFYEVGVTAQEGKFGMEADGANLFRFFCTGRKSVILCKITIDLARRQDLLCHHLVERFRPKRDLVTLDLPLDICDQIVFAMFRKKEGARMMDLYSDVKRYGKLRKLDACPSSHSVYSDSQETCEAIGGALAKELTGYLPDHVVAVIVSDQYRAIDPLHMSLAPRPTRWMRVVLDIKGGNDESIELQPKLVKIALALADFVNAHRVSDKARPLIVEGRRKADEEFQRRKAKEAEGSDAEEDEPVRAKMERKRKKR